MNLVFFFLFSDEGVNSKRRIIRDGFILRQIQRDNRIVISLDRPPLAILFQKVQSLSQRANIIHDILTHHAHDLVDRIVAR